MRQVIRAYSEGKRGKGVLDFRVDTFLMVTKYMNYTKAAEALNITQPAVSQHIRWLEDAYGVKLFQYQGKKLRVTKAGELLLAAATTMKHDSIFLRQRLAQLEEGESRLIFGATLTIGEYVLPERLAALLKRRPELKIKMVVANTRELLKEIDEGEVDFALVEGFFEKSQYDHLTFSRERYLPLCGPASPLARGPHRLEELLGERLLLREKGSGTREILDRLLESRNLSSGDFRELTEINNINVIKGLAREGRGVTFLYEAAVKRELKEGSLSVIALEDARINHDFTFVWRKDSVFADYYRGIFRELSAGEARRE